MSGSYRAPRRHEAERRKAEQLKLLKESGGKGSYLPDF